jgi:hypothetical protein
VAFPDKVAATHVDRSRIRAPASFARRSHVRLAVLFSWNDDALGDAHAVLDQLTIFNGAA